MYAKKKNWDLVDLRLELSHSKVHAADCEDCEQETGYVDVIEKSMELIGALDDSQITRLKDIAGRCPVHRTLEKSVKIRDV